MKKKITITVLLLLLLSVSLVVGFYLTRYQPNETYQKVDKIMEMSNEDIQANVDQIVKDGEINIQYSMGATFNGKESESFSVKNIPQNNGPIKFTLYDEDGNTIYTSDKIDQGYECTQITLDKELSKGTHDCRISIGYVDEGNVRSTFPISIEVK